MPRKLRCLSRHIPSLPQPSKVRFRIRLSRQENILHTRLSRGLRQLLLHSRDIVLQEGKKINPLTQFWIVEPASMGLVKSSLSLV
jgi:hypothetical protein